MPYLSTLVEAELDLTYGNSHYLHELPEYAFIGEETSIVRIDLFEVFLYYLEGLLALV